MADSRLDKLEAVVREMRKRLEPQAMANSLERAWSPRGYADWTRVTDSSGGQASPPRRLLQFPGATITDDPTIGDRGATVVTVGGSSGVEAIFSDDTTVTAAEEMRFVGQTAPGTTRASLRGTTTVGVGNQRRLDLLLADSNVTTQPRIRLTMRDGDTGDVAIPYRAELVAEASAGNTGGLTANIRSGVGVVSHDVNVFTATGAGVGTANLQAAADTMTAAISADANSLSGAGRITFAVNGTTRTLYSSSGDVSQFMQVAGAASTSTTPIRLVTRGPFSAAPGALAAGATAAVIVSTALFGTAAKNVVSGTVSGAAGVEDVAVSWVAGPGANQVTINFTNQGAVARTPTFQFTTVSDA